MASNDVIVKPRIKRRKLTAEPEVVKSEDKYDHFLDCEVEVEVDVKSEEYEAKYLSVPEALESDFSELKKGEQVKAQSPRKSTRKRLPKKYHGEFDEDGENSSCPVCNFDGATLDSSLSHIQEVSSCHFFKNHDTTVVP